MSVSEYWVSPGYSYITTTPPHMSDVRPSYLVFTNRNLICLNRFYVVLSTLLIVTLDQVCIYCITFFCLPSIVWLSNHFNALLLSDQVLTRRRNIDNTALQQLSSYHGFLSWYLTSEEDEQTVEQSTDICSICNNFDDIWRYEIVNTRYCSQIHFDIYQSDQSQCRDSQIIPVRKPWSEEKIKAWMTWRCFTLFCNFNSSN